MSARRGSPVPVQGSLAGMEAEPQSGSLFFGVFPAPAACEAIAVETDGLRAEHSLAGAPIKSSRLHATLHYLGEHAVERNDIIDKAVEAASRVTHAGFDMVLASASSWSRKPVTDKARLSARHRSFAAGAELWTPINCQPLSVFSISGEPLSPGNVSH